MEAKESYSDRLKMVEMHDDILKRIDTAIEKNKALKRAGFAMPVLKVE